MSDDERLVAWLLGEADADEAARVAAAVDDDPRVAARLAQLRAAEQLLSRAVPPEPGEAVTTRIHEQAMRTAAEVLDEGSRRGVGADDRARDGRAERGLSPWQRWLPAIGLAGLLVAAGVAFGLGELGRVGEDDLAADGAQEAELLDDSADADAGGDAAGGATDEAQATEDAPAAELDAAAEDSTAAAGAAAPLAVVLLDGVEVVDAGLSLDAADGEATARNVELAARVLELPLSGDPVDPVTTATAWGDGVVDDDELDRLADCLASDAMADVMPVRATTATAGVDATEAVVAVPADGPATVVEVADCPAGSG